MSYLYCCEKDIKLNEVIKWRVIHPLDSPSFTLEVSQPHAFSEIFAQISEKISKRKKIVKEMSPMPSSFTYVYKFIFTYSFVRRSLSCEMWNSFFLSWWWLEVVFEDNGLTIKLLPTKVVQEYTLKINVLASSSLSPLS